MVTLTRDIALPRDTDNIPCHTRDLTRDVCFCAKKILKIKKKKHMACY